MGGDVDIKDECGKSSGPPWPGDDLAAGNTALFYAAMWGHLPCIEALHATGEASQEGERELGLEATHKHEHQQRLDGCPGGDGGGGRS